ncbi:MAG: aromatic ring-hydroxylating dioxygenase subunit alpha [Limnoraphis sp. WC205]|jgi:phenylpropionate dioxygenase-like ring-hydroxylating dioxygenase large terminal subunit|nr:aromatic ring-hydroxylating dioxygenase subunit alpha [Limnoraphis sp. WC205]
MNQKIRQLGINPNHWYVVARSRDVNTQPLDVILWNQAIVLFRNQQGKIQALENRCPHRQVKLSHGKIIEGNLECAYHGWQFNAEGECVNIPYLAEHQRLPKCKISQYPVQELDGFIWLFPGENPTQNKPLGIPEWDHLNYIATVSLIHCQAHYSFLIENLMDMYHGHLHQDWQAWTDAILKNINEDNHRVDAHYQAKSYYKIDKIWSISQLFFPALRQLHPEPLEVSYIYPHWVSTLGKDFKIYCLFCPVSLTETKAYLIHFTSLHSFWRLHKLPIPFRRFLKNKLFGSAQKLLDGLVEQDVKMIEEEQQAYLNKPQQKGYEFNPTLASVQRLIQHQEFLE